MKKDLIAVVEAAYRVEKNQEDWLSGVYEAALPLLDMGLGGSAFLYDATDVNNLKIGTSIIGSGGNERVVAAVQKTTPDAVEWVFRNQACRTASESPRWKEQPAATAFAALGFEDVLFVNGVDPSAKGPLLTARMKKSRALSRKTIETWSFIAAHLAAGFRLREHIAPLAAAGSFTEHAEAIVTPNGKIEHLADALKEDSSETTKAIAVLRNAAVSVDRARGKLRRTAPAEALGGWTALAGARWTMLDHFDHDGRHYLLACANDPKIPRPELLSLRERQCLAYAALGHKNKLIAYELGITPSTVGVLLLRAAKKLSAVSRGDAIAIYRRTCG
ncbi:MAG: helix-turn-helix transcriptional regulator [Polyangiaceae bacterium]